MSLQYIIDAYNIINHSTFTRIHKKEKSPQKALLGLIRIKRLTGSPKNKVTVVFDGYPDLSAGKPEEADINVVFSRGQTADSRIKQMVEAAGNPKNIVVVSDDRQIKFFIKSIGAHSQGVEEFISPASRREPREDLIKPELNYSQIDKINRELKKIWLRD